MKKLVLQNTELFASLNDNEIESITEITNYETYRKDEIIINKGDTTTSLYVIVNGIVKAISTDSKEHEIIHKIFTPGDYFGEISMIDGQPRSATVKAMGPTRLLVIPRDKLRDLFSSNPDISFSLMKGLTSKIRETTKQVEDMAFIVMQNELNDAHLDTINRLVLAAEYKDYNTGRHITRISHYSALIAEKFGLPENDVETIRNAATMHDIGKIGIPESILLKPGKLSEKEFNIVKTHTNIGARILANPKSEVLESARTIALSHHEKFDGTGYPSGMSGNNIPVAARIVTIADYFDALVSSRPYKGPFSLPLSLDIIETERGKHFDPDLLDIFFEMKESIIKIKEEHSSKGSRAESAYTI